MGEVGEAGEGLCMPGADESMRWWKASPSLQQLCGEWTVVRRL